MKKLVFIKNDIVVEIMPQFINPYTINGIKQWYGLEFANHCTEAPEEVMPGWFYSEGTFYKEKPLSAEEKKAIRDEKVRQIMAAHYPNLTDEIGILYRGTEAEKALHEERYLMACAEADEYVNTL